MIDLPIGIFDSGVGGLTVLKEIFRELPNESTLYLGDTARVPYGIRSAETVTRYSLDNTGFLVSKGIKLLVVACNTASAVGLQKIKDSVKIPVIGVIEPGARAAVEATENGKIGVIGTEATIKSEAYVNAIKSFDASAEVFTLPCPLFVPLAEEGFTGDEIALLVAERYLCNIRNRGIDTLVLGCTHYPLLRTVISKAMGDKIVLIDSAVETAKEIKDTIVGMEMERKSTQKPWKMFYVTDSPDRFVRVGERFLDQGIENIEEINVDI